MLNPWDPSTLIATLLMMIMLPAILRGIYAVLIAGLSVRLMIWELTFATLR